jgi:hypothetical protein
MVPDKLRLANYPTYGLGRPVLCASIPIIPCRIAFSFGNSLNLGLIPMDSLKTKSRNILPPFYVAAPFGLKSVLRLFVRIELPKIVSFWIF